LKNSYYNLAGGGIRTAIALLTVPLLIRIIGLDEYGLWSLVMAAVGVIGLAEAGLSVATTKFIAEDLNGTDEWQAGQTVAITTICMFALATAAALFTWFGAEKICRIFPNLSPSQMERTVEALRLGAAVVWMRLLQQNFVGVQQGFQRFGSTNAILTAQVALANLGMIVVALAGGRLMALVKWHALIGFLGLSANGLMAMSLVKEDVLKCQWSAIKARRILRFSAFNWMSSLGSVLFGQVDRLVVGAFLETRVVGMYSAITTIAGQINLLSALPVQPLIPLINQTNVANRPALASEIKRAFQLSTITALSLALVIYSFAPLIVILVKELTPQTITPLRMAAVIYGVFSINATGYYILLGTNRLTHLLSIQLGSGVLSLILIVIGAGRYDLEGAVVGNVGYWGVWLLTFAAMRCVDIRAGEWLSWIRKILIWFAIAIMVNTCLTSLFLTAVATLIEVAILAAWFLKESGVTLKLKR
jgi:O-antigen/teichoic acid export membrane protein